jgi:hypothetical protein
MARKKGVRGIIAWGHTSNRGAMFVHSHEAHRAERIMIKREKVVLEDCCNGAKQGEEDHSPRSRCKAFKMKAQIGSRESSSWQGSVSEAVEASPGGAGPEKKSWEEK